ncbi:MAG: hypothetical protein ACTSW7_01485 [Candidatus Thorarchaeota archaeon]
MDSELKMIKEMFDRAMISYDERYEGDEIVLTIIPFAQSIDDFSLVFSAEEQLLYAQAT